MAFLEGNNGRLFRELAVTLAGAVAISAFVALSLTPMMCSLLLQAAQARRHRLRCAGSFARLKAMTDGYQRQSALLVGRPWLFARHAGRRVGRQRRAVHAGAARTGADRGSRRVLRHRVTGPEGAGFDYIGQADGGRSSRSLLKHEGEDKPFVMINRACPAVSSAGGEMHQRPGDRDPQAMERARAAPPRRGRTTCRKLRPDSRRTRPAAVRQAWCAARPAVAVRAAAVPTMRSWCNGATVLQKRMEANPRLTGVDSDYKETRPQLRVEIDRDRAADLGVSVSEIGSTLETMLGSRRVTTFVRRRRGIRRARAGRARTAPASPTCEPVRALSRSGDLVPLSSGGRRQASSPSRARSTLQSPARRSPCPRGLTPGYTLGEALAVRAKAAQRGTAGRPPVSTYGGQSREYLSVGRRRHVHFRHGPAGGVPGAGRAVREFRASAGDHADRAAGGARRAARAGR